MKPFRNSLVALLCLLILVGLVWLTKSIKQNELNKTEKQLKILQIDPKEITTLHILSNPPFTLKRVDPPAQKLTFGRWVFADREEERVDKNALQTFIKSLTELKASRLITKQTGKIEIFGLDRPEFQITVEGQGFSQTLWIGGKLPIGRETYVKRGDLSSIFVISQEQLKPLRQTKEWFVDRQIMPFEPNGVLKLEATTFGVMWVAEMGDPNKKENLEKLLLAFQGLRAIRVVQLPENPQSLEVYGLNNLWATFTFYPVKGNPLILQIGSQPANHKENTIVYILIPGGRYIYGVPFNMLAFLEPFKKGPENWFKNDGKN